MTAETLEHLLGERLRCALRDLLCAHPRWTLGALIELQSSGQRWAPLLGELTVGELLADRDGAAAPDGGPPIDLARLARAKAAEGEDFDDYVREVLVEAGRLVGAAYLRARVGGPRWKLQASLRRLENVRIVERRGSTSSTRYRIVASRGAAAA